jgi:hypothetical protein
MMKRKCSDEESGDDRATKRKCSGCCDEGSSDDLWQPEDTSDEEPCEARDLIQTRSRGSVVRPADTTPIDAAMDKADTVVDNESDLSSDTEEDSSDDEEQSGSEEDEEEESDEDDYSDDDSFVTSNEDADRGDRDDVLESYSSVFDADEEYNPEPSEDPSIGGPAICDL